MSAARLRRPRWRPATSRSRPGSLCWVRTRLSRRHGLSSSIDGPDHLGLWFIGLSSSIDGPNHLGLHFKMARITSAGSRTDGELQADSAAGMSRCRRLYHRASLVKADSCNARRPTPAANPYCSCKLTARVSGPVHTAVQMTAAAVASGKFTGLIIAMTLVYTQHMDCPQHQWPESPRGVVPCAPRAWTILSINGPNHLGLH